MTQTTTGPASTGDGADTAPSDTAPADTTPTDTAPQSTPTDRTSTAAVDDAATEISDTSVVDPDGTMGTPATDAGEATGTPDAHAGEAGTPDAGAASEGAPAGGASDDASEEPGDGSPRRTAAQRLEEEGDVAADYLEELLDITDLDGDIDIDVENGRAAVSIVADQSDPASARALTTLVGRDGEVLEALQELTRLAVQTRTGERTRLMLDVAGFRAGRRTELEQLALATVSTVKESGTAVSLDPMSPFERKVVHDAVAGAGLRSESEGEGSDRRVVVLPAEE